MKQFNHIKKGVLLFIVLVAVSACKKNKDVAIKDVAFSLVSTGYEVTFTNTTTDAKSYRWDFGDKTSSTATSPTHTYLTKGKFAVTLYATLNSGTVISGSTIVNVSKNSPIKLDDSSLADWDTISTTIVSTAKGGIVKKAKFDYDATNVYVYMEIATTVAAGNIFDFYLDTDNSAATGLLTSSIPGGGYDYLLEGPLFTTNGLVQYLHTGGQSDFAFSPQSIPDYYKVGTVVEANGLVKFEMALVRSKIGGLTGKALTFGIVVSDSGYNNLGFMPDAGANAITLDISQ